MYPQDLFSFGHPDRQPPDLIHDSGPPSSSLATAVVFIGNQPPMPSYESIGRDKGSDFSQGFPTKILGLGSQPTPLLVGEAKSLPAELLSKNHILFSQVFDRIQLLLIDPSSQADGDEPKQIQAHFQLRQTINHPPSEFVYSTGHQEPKKLSAAVASVGGPQVLELSDGRVVIAAAQKLAIGRPGAFKVLTPANGYPSVGWALVTKDDTIWLSNANGLFVLPHSVLGPGWIRGMGQASAGGYVCDALFRGGREALRDQYAGVRRPIERDRPEPGKAPETLSAEASGAA